MGLEATFIASLERGAIDKALGILEQTPALLTTSVPKNPSGWYPLHVVVNTCRASTLDALLVTIHPELLKKIISQKTIEGYTPLHIAALTGRLDIVKSLIAAGANIHSLTNNHETPLFLAIRNNHQAVIHYLFICGADPMVLPLTNESLLEMVISKGFYFSFHK